MFWFLIYCVLAGGLYLLVTHLMSLNWLWSTALSLLASGTIIFLTVIVRHSWGNAFTILKVLRRGVTCKSRIPEAKTTGHRFGLWWLLIATVSILAIHFCPTLCHSTHWYVSIGIALLATSIIVWVLPASILWPERHFTARFQQLLRGTKHTWLGCRCTSCGTFRNADHSWQECKCTVCGRTREGWHRWKFCRCLVCGGIQDADHDWQEGRCSVCGRPRDFQEARSSAKAEKREEHALERLGRLTDNDNDWYNYVSELKECGGRDSIGFLRSYLSRIGGRNSSGVFASISALTALMARHGSKGCKELAEFVASFRAENRTAYPGIVKSLEDAAKRCIEAAEAERLTQKKPERSESAKLLPIKTRTPPVRREGLTGFTEVGTNELGYYEYCHSQTGMVFVLIPGGTFQMGSNDNDHTKPIHQVTVSPFLIGKYDVTQDVWYRVMGTNPSKNNRRGDHPVENVTWDSCQGFCKATSLRLPTEAEWEYACRAGTATKYFWGDTVDDDFLWYRENADEDTHPVGQKRPNGFGLYDMNGNVCEWCGDWYDAAYYKISPSDNPTGPISGEKRVERGGSFCNRVDFVDSAFRGASKPSDCYAIGFRCALSVKLEGLPSCAQNDVPQRPPPLSCTCPDCETGIELPRNATGKIVCQCPKCHARFNVEIE